MASWHRIKITAKDASEWRHGDIQDEFTKQFILNLGPDDAALFAGDWQRELDRSQFYYMYVSPGGLKMCPSLVLRYNAEQCDEPPKGTLSLLVGRYLREWRDFIVPIEKVSN